jgi:hypothetical protein
LGKLDIKPPLSKPVAENNCAEAGLAGVKISVPEPRKGNENVFET